MSLLYYCIFNTDADIDTDVPLNIADNVMTIGHRANLYGIRTNLVHTIVVNSDDTLYYASITTKRWNQKHYRTSSFASYDIMDVVKYIRLYLTQSNTGVVIFIKHNKIRHDPIKIIMKPLRVKRKPDKYFEIKGLPEHAIGLY